MTKKYYVTFIRNGKEWNSDIIEIDPETQSADSDTFQKIIVSRMNRYSAIYDPQPFVFGWSEVIEKTKKEPVYPYCQGFYDEYEDW